MVSSRLALVVPVPPVVADSGPLDTSCAIAPSSPTRVSHVALTLRASSSTSMDVTRTCRLAPSTSSMTMPSSPSDGTYPPVGWYASVSSTSYSACGLV